MAVTNESSTEYLKATDPRTNGLMAPEVTPQKIKYARFNFTQGVAAGDIGSTADLVRLPAGRIVVFPKASLIQWSAFGAARTLDVGYASYTDEDGTTVVAAAAVWDDDVDVTAAGVAALGSDLAAATGGAYDFKSDNGVKILATVAGGTIPAGATLKGYVAYAEVGP